MRFLQQSLNGQNSWWRYGIVLGVFLTPFLSGLINNYFLKPLLIFFEAKGTLRFAIIQFKYIVLLVLFLSLFSLLHKRSYKELITSRREFSYMRLGLGFAIWGVLLMSVLSTKVISNPDMYEWNFKLTPFLKLFVLSLLLLPFRVFFTAVFMNSYILQMFTGIFKKAWLSFFVSVLFFSALMCLNNISVIKALGNQMVIYYLALSILVYLIIILDEGIEIVLGMFLVSTLISRLFIAYTASKTQLDTIFIKQGNRDADLFVYVIPLICFPLFFMILYKIYSWVDWREKLFGKVEELKEV